MSSPKRQILHALKFKEDIWCSSPPSVINHITYSRPKHSHKDSPPKTYTSPICGFGWRFELEESFQYQTPASNPHIQELVGHIDLHFDPYKCSSMPLSDVSIAVKVTYPDVETDQKAENLGHEKEFGGIAVKVDGNKTASIGAYAEPPQYKGRAYFQITITFDPADGLSLPNTSTSITRQALRQTLESPSFVDTKFYLFSAKDQDGRPARPRALFAKSDLLTSSSTFLKELLSKGSAFSTGTPCDLFEDVAEEIAKLNPDSFDYDSDSDLESDDNVFGTPKGKEKDSDPHIPDSE
ncbi:hypothetical protein AN958_01497 [Leucoagaricus sp. SymC.cos]|nr:hypothetical protein AN958_01497 [Leucoagaricus sp. SymC.cos]